jgi:hypothetical protein
MAETPEQRRQRLVNEAKSKVAMDKLEQSAASATDADRAAAYGSVGKPKPAPQPAAEEAAADADGAEYVSAGAADGNVSDRIRSRGTEAARAGLSLLSEADRKVSYQVANRDYRSTKGYTDAMQGQAPVHREGRFKAARAGLATLRPPEAAPAPQPAQGAPVQVTIQTAPTAEQPAPSSTGKALPAGVAPKALPGQLPTTTVPSEAIPLEGDPPTDETPEQEMARLEAEAASMTPEQLEAQAAADYVGEPAPEPTAEELAAEADARKGIMQRQLDAEEDLSTARVGVAQAEADAMSKASEQYQGALSQAEAAKAEQDAIVANRLAASEEANRLVERTAKEAIDAAAVDPKRAWSTMGLGRKAAFTLSSIALGIAGNSDPTQYMRRYIDEDIEQQREASAKAQANVGTAREAAAEQGNLYSRTLAAVGDQRVAADVVRVARIDQITSDLKARLSAAGVQQVSAEQEAFLTKLEEDKAAAQMRIQNAADHKPQTFTKTAYVYGKGTREGMRLLGKEQIKSGVGAAERADTQEADLEKIDYKGRIDKLEAEAKAAAKRGDKAAEQAYAFGKDTERLQATMGMVDELLSADDIPGYGYTEGVGTPGKADTDNQIRLIIDELGRIKSGGAITEDEFESFSNMVTSGVYLGDGSIFEGSETRLRKNLAQVRKFMERKVTAMERGLKGEARDYYNRNVAGADFEARWSGGGDESVVEED